jgi:diguanylate cyclase (GGDEF)-like protein
MNPESSAAGFALACDLQGNILRVIHDDLGIQDLAEPGCPVTRLADRASFEKLLNFLVELRDHGSALDWEVRISVRGQAVAIHLAGIRSRRELLIGGALLRDGLFQVLQRLLSIPDESAPALPAPFAGEDMPALDQGDRGEGLYDQISRFNNELVTLQRDLAKKNAELERLYAEVQRLAITDVLTGVYNRRGFFELGRHEVARAHRFARPLSLIMFDLDHFKQVNDTYGHGAGDEVLAQVAARCRAVTRQVEVLGRYGGEEFVVLLPETAAAGAYLVGERLRLIVSATPIDTRAGPVEITISFGVAALAPEMADLESLLEGADRLLYQAKEAGRNRGMVGAPG